jgi:ABC-2 type transport system ATP-binding protein
MAAICSALPACDTTTDGLRLSVRFDRFLLTAGEIAAAVMSQVEVVDFRIDEPEVEDLIRKVYLGQLSLDSGGAATEALEPASLVEA